MKEHLQEQKVLVWNVDVIDREVYEAKGSENISGGPIVDEDLKVVRAISEKDFLAIISNQMT
jgi:hypothetical protein